MLYNAKNGLLTIDDVETEYISFGSGEKTLIILPGVGDGLKTVGGMALPFAFLYRQYARTGFKVYVFSRRRKLPRGFTTADMADDLDAIMEKLGIHSADVVGVSQGGMIAQKLAARHPGRVRKLVLAVTLARENDTIRSAIDCWKDMAEKGDYKGIMLDTAERSYSERYLKKQRWMYSLIGSFGKPKSFERFIIMANSCLTHNSCDELPEITCPTLIIGGSEDKIVSAEASKELAEGIKGSALHIYEGLGHAAYEEAKDFNSRILAFLS